MLGLTGFEHAYPGELSDGMSQRADLIAIWRQEKKTILLVTHEAGESVRLANRVVRQDGIRDIVMGVFYLSPSLVPRRSHL